MLEQRPTILLVETDDELRGLLVETLEWEGFSVVAAAGRDAAVESLAGPGPIDAVVLGLMLAGEDGEAILDAVLWMRPKTPTLVVTAAAGRLNVAAWPGRARPIKIGELAEGIRRALGQSGGP